MTIAYRVLGADDLDVLGKIAPDVFDNPIDPRLADEFLRDPRHHIAVALDDGVVVGFASAVHYVHPDKAPELWINEVGVAASHHRRGIASRLLEGLFAAGRRLGCQEAWVLTERDNAPARGLYAAVGGRAREQLMFSIPLSGEGRAKRAPAEHPGPA